MLRSGLCKSAYVREMGKAFWEDNLANALSAGLKIGKSEHVVKQEISFAMVSIYENLKPYYKTYDFLIEQVTGCSWLHLFTVKNIVKKVGYCDRLTIVLYIRFEKDDLSPENRMEFEKIKNGWFLSGNLDSFILR